MGHVFLFFIEKVKKNQFWLRESQNLPHCPTQSTPVVFGERRDWFGIPAGVQALNMQFSHLHGVVICINRTAASWMACGRFVAANNATSGHALPMQPGAE